MGGPYEDKAVVRLADVLFRLTPRWWETARYRAAWRWNWSHQHPPHGSGDSPCRERESSGECRWRPFSTTDSTYVCTRIPRKLLRNPSGWASWNIELGRNTADSCRQLRFFLILSSISLFWYSFFSAFFQSVSFKGVLDDCWRVGINWGSKVGTQHVWGQKIISNSYMEHGWNSFTKHDDFSTIIFKLATFECEVRLIEEFKRRKCFKLQLFIL